MADPLSITASIVGITAAGVQVSISLFALADKVSTASERVNSIANDISSTCGILNQLRDLITPQPGYVSAHNTSIFNPTALSDIHSAVHYCRSIFSQIKKFLERATKQINHLAPHSNLKVTLSRSEKAKWPFLQAAVQDLRNDLRDSKTNLLLMVAVANLAVAQRRGQFRSFDMEEQADLKATIVRLQRMKTLDLEVSDVESEKEKDNLVKRLMQKLGLRRSGRKDELEDDADDARVQGSRAFQANTTAREDIASSRSTEEQSHSLDIAPSPATSAPPHQPASHVSHQARSDEPEAIDEDPEQPQTLTSHSEDRKEETDKIEGEEPMGSDSRAAQDTNTVDKEKVSNMVQPNKADGDAKKEGQIGYEPRFVDVAVQTSAEKNVLQDSLPSNNASGVGDPSRVLKFVQRSTKTSSQQNNRPKPSKVQGSPKLASSSLSDPIYANEEKPNSDDIKDAKDEYLQAWIFSILPGLTMGHGSSLGVMDLSMPGHEIRALLEKQETQRSNVLASLNQLNTYQRCAVLEHTRRSRSRLLYVDVWHRESIATVFGELEIVTLMWVTTANKKIDLFDEPPFEEQGWDVGMGDLKGKGKATDAAPATNEAPVLDEPIYFKDCVGRHFVFPFHMVKSWKGMEDLIKQAFLHVDVIGPHVHQGHYDLVDSNNKVILPQVWSSFVKPAWDISMHMWPMVEPRPSEPRPQYPPPPPPEAARFTPQDRPLRKAYRADNVPPRPGFVPAPPPPQPPPPGMEVPPPSLQPAEIHIISPDHENLKHSVDVNRNDLSVLKWMAGTTGPGLGKPNLGKEKTGKQHVGTHKGKKTAKEEDKIVDNLLLKWTG